MKEYVLNNPPLWHIVHICTLDIWLSEKNKNSIKLCQVHTLLQINYLAINQSSLVFKYFRVRWSCNILKYKYKILQLKKKTTLFTITLLYIPAFFLLTILELCPTKTEQRLVDDIFVCTSFCTSCSLQQLKGLYPYITDQ